MVRGLHTVPVVAAWSQSGRQWASLVMACGTDFAGRIDGKAGINVLVVRFRAASVM